MILFGSSFSPFVRKVMVYATEKGISLDQVQIARPNPQPEFLRASPLGKMPALVDSDFGIADSTAIIAYLEIKYPQSPMYPSDAQGRARAVWFEEFADTVMAAAVFKVFFNRIVAPRFRNTPCNEDVVRECEQNDLPVILNYLESVAPDPGQFLVGPRIGVADISVASMFLNYQHAKANMDASKYRRTFAWVESILERPSFAGIVTRERRLLAA
jgi:glutathione S-transferase